LKLVTIKDHQRNTAGETVDQKYYRYNKLYGRAFDGNTDSDANIELPGYSTRGPTNVLATTGGTDTTFPRDTDNSDSVVDNVVMSGLKSVIEGASFSRLAANLGGVSDFADDADAVVNAYAQYAFQYERVDPSHYTQHTYPDAMGRDTRYRVIQETVAAEGCSSCSHGFGTFKFEYYVGQQYTTYALDDLNPNDQFTPHDTNGWYLRTTEYLPDTTESDWTDNDQNIVYTNELGQVILFVQFLKNGTASTSDDNKLLTYHRYDEDGRETYTVHPSALSGYSENNADLIDFSATSSFLSQNSGLIERFEYETDALANPAGATTPGNVVGLLKNAYVRKGFAGADIKVSSQTYYKHEYGGAQTNPIAESSVYADVTGDGVNDELKTSYSYVRRRDASNVDTTRIESMTVTHPLVSSSRNGSGVVADTETVVYDAVGRPIWIKDADDFLTYLEYDDRTGAVSKRIVDVDTSQTSDFADKPSTWSTPSGGGLHLVTTMTVDGLGRTTKETAPNGNVTFTVYKDAQHETRQYRSAAGSFSQVGPVVVTREYRPVESAPAGERQVYYETLTSSATPTLGIDGTPNGNETIDGPDIQSLTRELTSDAGQIVEIDRYFDPPDTGYSQADPTVGTPSSNYHATLIAYDQTGEVKRVEGPTGTITRTIYDGLGRPTSVWVGTDDIPTSEYWSPTNNAGANMTQVASYVYDNGSVGDGNLTQITRFPGGTAANRVTEMAYDWRNRLIATKTGATATLSTEAEDVQRQVEYRVLDNLGRTISLRGYDGDTVNIRADGNADGIPDSPASTRLHRQVDTGYDERGRIFHNTAINVGTSQSLRTDHWYDGRGNVIKVSAPGGLVTKTKFDGAGRAVNVYTSDGGNGSGGVESGYGDAFTVAGDVILTQTETQYDENGNVILTITKDRFHDESAADALGDANTGPRARVSYRAYHYDPADRLLHAIDVGTNFASGTDFTLHDDLTNTLPSRSAGTALITSYGYDAAGRVASVTDPRGIVTRTYYDSLGRATKTVENADADGDTLPGSGDDRTTLYTYNGNGDVLTITADLPSGTTDQVTTYAYGVTAGGGSNLTSNDLLASVTYPDTGPANDSETFTYNALGQRTGYMDRNGTTHAYAYDAVGRTTADVIAALGSGVDGHVRRLAFSFDSAGRPHKFTSYNAVSGGDAIHEVRREYNGLGQLTKESQDDPDRVGGTAPAVQYAYGLDDGSNRSVLTSVTYPNGRVVEYNYGTTGGLNDRISRLDNIADTTGILESYSYVGFGTTVNFAHPQSGIDLTYVGTTTGEAGDHYSGLDRFGRVIDQRWVDDNGTSTTADDVDIDRFRYGYDANGNRLYKENVVDPTKSESYVYDGLDRLTSFDRGTLNSTKTGISGTIARQQDWTLDALGNWNQLQEGATTETRQHNGQNQVTVVGSAALDYDANGNMLTDEEGRALTYDAWNRLARVYASGGNLLASYRYDALGRRTAETALAQIDGAAVTLTGTSGDDTFTIAAGTSAGTLTLTVNGGSPQTINDDELLLHFGGVGGGNDTLNISAGVVHLIDDAANWNLALNVTEPGAPTLVEIASDRQHLSSLSIGAGATVRLQPGRATILVIAAGTGGSQLSIASGGTLDVADNAVIVRSTSTNKVADTDEIYEWAKLGMTPYMDWSGTGVTSAAAAASVAAGDVTAGVVSLGMILNDWGGGDAMYASILGENVTADDVIVRFSFAGDSDLNGFVEGADYGTIDNYSQFPGADGYQNGDFNYDGVIDGADYGVIDQTILFQSQGRLEPYTRRLLYSDQWQVLEERLGGVTDTQYVWSPRYVDAMIVRDRDTDGNGSLEQRHYVQQDANFNVTSVTNASGVVQERFIYDPYGTVEVLNPDWTSDSDGSDHGWQYLHQGGRYDAASGLYSFRHREYSSGLGRWAQQDPAGYVDGMSAYEALASSPVTMLDADGLQAGAIGGRGTQTIGGPKRGGGPTTQPDRELQSWRDGTWYLPDNRRFPVCSGWNVVSPPPKWMPDWGGWKPNDDYWVPGTIVNSSDKIIWWYSNEGGWRPLPPGEATPPGVDADGWAPGDRKPGDPIWKVEGPGVGGADRKGKPRLMKIDGCEFQTNVKVPETEFGTKTNQMPPTSPPDPNKKY
jgi:RHS repeat-associated protein